MTKYEIQVLEDKNSLAQAASDLIAQIIESILKNRLDSTHEHQNHQTPVINSHKNIRGSNYYQ